MDGKEIYEEKRRDIYGNVGLRLAIAIVLLCCERYPISHHNVQQVILEREDDSSIDNRHSLRIE